jgi:hypothetical protein
MDHLKSMLAQLKACEYENNAFHLGVALPSERTITDAMNHCAQVYQQPPESVA